MEKFDRAYNQFLFEKDAGAHKKAAHDLLSTIGLAEKYYFFLDDRKKISNFFLCWRRGVENETDENEKRGLEQPGKLAQKHFTEKNYKELCKLFAGLALRHISEFLNLKNRADFEQITDFDLYEKNLLPNEILLQFFLLETLSKTEDFDWDRGEEIIEQNLACLIVCFSDIYEFLNEYE